MILSVILLFMLRILFLSMCNQIFIWDISCYWFLHLNVTYRAPWTKVKRGLLEFITPKSWVISFDCSSGIDVKMDESNFRGEFRVKFQGQISMWAFKFPSAKLMDLMEYLEGLTSSKSGIFWVQYVKDAMLKCAETSTETILHECMNTW